MISNFFDLNINTVKYIFLAILFIPTFVFGQIPTFSLDANLDYFDGGTPLPADTRWKLNGQAPAEAEIVRLAIVENGKLFDQPDYVTEHSIRKGDQGFELYLDFPLQSGKKYDFEFVFYMGKTDHEINERYTRAKEELDAFIDRSVYSSGARIQLRESTKATFRNLNQILARHYPETIKGKQEFSNRVYRDLKSLNGTHLKEAKFNLEPKTDSPWRDSKYDYLIKRSGELKAVIRAELHQISGSNGLKMIGKRMVKGYPVQKRSFSLPINVGYAGIYNSGAFSNLDYATAPYAGISVPIGGRRVGEHLALGIGAFLTDATFQNGDVATGPIVGRPIYIALGVKALRIFRFQVGATALQTQRTNSTADVSLRPFVGAAIEINLWAGFGQR